MSDARVALIEAFTRAWNDKDVDGVMALMADDCEFRASVGPEPGTAFTGRAEVRRGFGIFLAPSDAPDPETEVGPLLVGADFAVTRWTSRWPGPDGTTVEVRACDVFEFDGERIRSKDTYRKVLGPPPGG
jgi:ketosteroid isomerase-like protein